MDQASALTRVLAAHTGQRSHGLDATEPCRVPGCGGHVHFTTDGQGRLVSWCSACEQRVLEVTALRVALKRARGA